MIFACEKSAHLCDFSHYASMLRPFREGREIGLPAARRLSRGPLCRPHFPAFNSEAGRAKQSPPDKSQRSGRARPCRPLLTNWKPARLCIGKNGYRSDCAASVWRLPAGFTAHNMFRTMEESPPKFRTLLTSSTCGRPECGVRQVHGANFIPFRTAPTPNDRCGRRLISTEEKMCPAGKHFCC